MCVCGRRLELTSKGGWEKQTQSFISCAVHCGHVPLCRMFCFVLWSACVCADGDEKGQSTSFYLFEMNQ